MFCFTCIYAKGHRTNQENFTKISGELQLDEVPGAQTFTTINKPYKNQCIVACLELIQCTYLLDYFEIIILTGY